MDCTLETCTKEATQHTQYGLDLPRRFFQINYEDGSFESQKITSLAGSQAVMIVPMDLDDDGKIDALVQRCV